MCGIAGIIKFLPSQPPPRAALDAMSQAIAHRGPDGSGTYIDPRPGKSAALLHRRLAIIDRAGGHQPMANENATVHVVFNGEIYNHAALRRQLQQAGHTFTSDHSDTEVLVHGWEQWGTDLPQHLTGMFAFAIYDTRPPQSGPARDTLFLARDRMGQKPLFYAILEDGIVFGSTITSILAWPQVPRRTPREALATYLQLGYFPPPLTPFRDISQLMPGHWLRTRAEVIDGKSYWNPVPDEAPIESATSSSDQLRPVLTAAVQSQMIADVPIACFLSGGIDSSIIALLMQNAAKSAGGDPIHTVAVGFTEAGFDETQYAATVAKRIGSRHTRLEVSANQNVIETLQHLLRTSLGMPFADSSILPTHHLSKAVRDIAPVALAGDGGDELFAGYDRYRAMQLLDHWGNVLRFAPRRALLVSLSRRERYRRLMAAAQASSLAERYTRLVEITAPGLVEHLIQDSPGSHAELPITAGSSFRYALFRDQLDYLPGDLLFKVDAAAMAVALEVRAPFLDHALVHFANSLPDDALLRGRGRSSSKFILRQTFAHDLPPQILSRGKKGFAVPVGTWFNTSLKAPLHDLLLSPTSFTAQHLNQPAIQRLLDEHHAQTRDHTHRLFALLMLELWAQEFRPTIE